MRTLGNDKQQVKVLGSFNDIIHHRLYFGASDGTASVIAAAEYRIWANGVGQTENNISTGAAITLKECDTTLSGENGIIPNGENFIVTNIGIKLQVFNQLATTPFTGNAVNTVNVTPIVKPSPIPFIENFMAFSTFELYRNSDERLERGTLCEYPTPFGSQAVAGGGAATVPALSGGAQASYAVNPTIMNGSNGIMWRELSVYHIFQQLDQFYGILKVHRAIDLASTQLSGWIDFYLAGKATTNYETEQIVARFS